MAWDISSMLWYERENILQLTIPFDLRSIDETGSSSLKIPVESPRRPTNVRLTNSPQAVNDDDTERPLY